MLGDRSDLFNYSLIIDCEELQTGNNTILYLLEILVAQSWQDKP
jgi:hypothetical protein